MATDYLQVSGGDRIAETIHNTFRAFPIACFPMALASDVAYAQTSNLLWLHFAEWLLFAGIAGVTLALVAVVIDVVVRRVRPSWLAILSGVIVFVLALVNNLVHTRDGWTAVVPLGLGLSVATVIALLATAWFGRKGYHHG